MELTGLSTGIDTAAIVQQLMAASQQRLYSYKVQKQEYELKNSTLEELRSKISTLNSSVSALSDIDDLVAFKATSSDKDILSATAASTGVYEGNHEVEVNQLANSEKWVHSGFLFEESLVGSGNFIYSYNHQEIVIDTNETTTLTDLAGLINNDVNNPGVTASILEYDNGNDGVFHLVLSGNDAGSDYNISINSSTTQVLSTTTTLLDTDGNEVTLSTKITDLADFSGTLDGTEKIEITGTGIAQKDLDITDEITVGHLIKRINDAFKGVAKAELDDGKIKLTDDVSGDNSTSITLTFSGGGGADPASLTLPTFSTDSEHGGTAGGQLSNIMSADDFLRTQQAQDSQVKIDGYPPAISEIQTLAGTATDGTFTLTYDGQTTGDIAYNASAEQIKSALENLSNIDTDDITVTGTLSGGNITFQFKDTLGDVSSISIDSTNLTPAAQSNYNVTETTKGQAWMTSSSNSVTAYGMTMNLYETGTVQISLNKDTNSLKSKIKNMVNSYNDVRDFIKDKSSYDEETGEAGDLLSSYTVRVIKRVLRESIFNPATGFDRDEEEFVYAYDIGIDFESGAVEDGGIDYEMSGRLSFDDEKFDEAIAENYQAVASLLAASNTGKSNGNDEDLISFHASSQYTEVGDYDVKVETEGGSIKNVWIKLSSEGTWRQQNEWTETGIITMNGRLNSDSDWYPERDLQIAIDLDEVPSDGTYETTISVQRGIVGNILETLDDILKTDMIKDDPDDENETPRPVGYLHVETYNSDQAIDALNDRIEAEQDRLNRKEQRLKEQYARLEKTLTQLQNQYSQVTSMLSS